jgi:hypothetical protein
MPCNVNLAFLKLMQILEKLNLHYKAFLMPFINDEEERKKIFQIITKHYFWTTSKLLIL